MKFICFDFFGKKISLTMSKTVKFYQKSTRGILGVKKPSDSFCDSHKIHWELWSLYHVNVAAVYSYLDIVSKKRSIFLNDGLVAKGFQYVLVIGAPKPYDQVQIVFPEVMPLKLCCWPKIKIKIGVGTHY